MSMTHHMPYGPELFTSALSELAAMMGGSLVLTPARMSGWQSKITKELKTDSVQIGYSDRALVAWGDDPSEALLNLWNLLTSFGTFVMYTSHGMSSIRFSWDNDRRCWIQDGDKYGGRGYGK